MPFDENEYDRLKAWDEEPADPEPDGDADDVDTAGVEAAASVGGQPMELPEMDFTEHAMMLPEMDFSTPAAGGEVPRLRAPTKTAAEPPPAASMAPNGDAPPDWKSIGQRLGLAGIGKADSRNYESLFANAGNVGAYRPNPHAGEVLTDTARLPVDLAKEQQGYESRDMALQGQKSKIAQTSAERDPNSLQSQKARNAIKAMGLKPPEGFEEWSAADVKQFIDTGALTRLEVTRAAGEAKQAKAQADEAERQRRIALHDKERSEDLKHRREMEKIGWAAAARGDRAADRADNPKLPPGQLAEVADYDTAAKAADELYAAYEAADLEGVLSKVAGKASDATGADLGAVSQYNDKANTAAQTIGLALEGGKLGEADLPRYRAMLPAAGDSRERAAAKRDNLKRALADKAAGRSVEWLKAGYKVPDAGGGDEVVTGKSGRKFKKTPQGWVPL